MLWIPVHLVIESFPLLDLEVAYEHRLYLPSVGAAALAGIAAVRFAHKKRSFALSAAVCGATLALAFAWTVQRNLIWETEETLWGDVVSKAPNNARRHNNPAAAYLRQNRLEEAVAEFEAAVRLAPYSANAHEHYGNILRISGKIDLALSEYLQALTLGAPQPETLNNLGLLYYLKGDHERAAWAFRGALRLDPSFETARRNLKVVLDASGTESIQSPHAQ